MKKIVIMVSLLMVAHSNFMEESFVKPRPVKKESVNQLKQSLAHEYDTLLASTTSTIKQLTNLVDEVIVNVKQLAGSEQGALASADKKMLQQYQQQAQQIQQMLDQLQKNCTICPT